MSAKEKKSSEEILATDPFSQAIKKFFVLLRLKQHENTDKALTALLNSYPEIPSLLQHFCPVHFSKLIEIISKEKWEFLYPKFQKLFKVKLKKTNPEQIEALKKYFGEYLQNFSMTTKFFADIVHDKFANLSESLTKNPRLACARYNSRTALICAVENVRPKTVGLLLEHIDEQHLNSGNFQGARALHYAAEIPNDEPLRMLLSDPRTLVGVKMQDGRTPLHIVAAKGYIDHAKLLLEKMTIEEIDAVDGLTNTALCLAALKEQKAMVKLLLNVLDKRLTLDLIAHPLRLALVGKNYEIVAMLLEAMDKNGIEYTEDPFYLLELADGHAELFELLLNNQMIRSNIKVIYERELILVAAQKGDVGLFKTLLRTLKNHEIIARDQYDSTALEIAFRHGKTEILAAILHDGRISKYLESQATPLLFSSIMYDQADATQVMLENLRPEQINRPFKTAEGMISYANFALSEGFINVAKVVLASEKVEINPEELYGGQTLLHRIVLLNDVSLLEIALARGIRINCVNEAGETALQLALKQKTCHSKIIRLLKSAQKEISVPSPSQIKPLEEKKVTTDELKSNSGHVSPENDTTTPLSFNKPPLGKEDTMHKRGNDLSTDRPHSSPTTKEEKTDLELGPLSFGTSGKVISALRPSSPGEENLEQKKKHRLRDGNLKKSWQERNQRYEVAFSVTNNKAGYFSGSQPIQERPYAGHYYYVADSDVERERGVPLYIYVTDEVVAKAKSVGAWQANEQRLQDGVKFIGRKDKDSSGVKYLKHGFYELCNKDKMAGNARLYSSNATFDKQYVEELGKTVFVMKFDGFADSHRTLKKRLADHRPVSRVA